MSDKHDTSQTAKGLADWLDGIAFQERATSFYELEEAAKMLRSQDAELERLRAECEQIRADAQTCDDREGWVPTTERLPKIMDVCDWLFPASYLKCERWVLCSESMATASVPGTATHWRPARNLPSIPEAIDAARSKEQA